MKKKNIRYMATVRFCRKTDGMVYKQLKIRRRGFPVILTLSAGCP